MLLNLLRIGGTLKTLLRETYSIITNKSFIVMTMMTISLKQDRRKISRKVGIETLFAEWKGERRVRRNR